MIMFSDLRRFDVVDSQGRHAKLFDLSVALLDEDYPPVTRVFFIDDKKKTSSLPWGDVTELKTEQRQLIVDDLAGAKRESTSSLAKEVLLGDDILDALVLDLQNRRTTRANDLCLEEENDRLLLRAADTGLGAIARRLSGGWYRHASRNALYDWKYVEFLRGDPEAVRNGEGYHLRVARLPPGEIARLSDFLPYLHASELITLLPDEKAVDVIEVLSPERQLQVFEELNDSQGLALLKLMAPDVAADLLGRLPTKVMRGYLNKLPKLQSERLIELLSYPEDTVGGIMTNDFVHATKTLTVGETREQLKEALKKPDFVFIIFVVESQRSKRLCGKISLRSLITADDDKLLEEIMDPYLVTLNPHMPATTAAHRIIDGHVTAMPVVDDGGRLLGLVTIDAAINRVAPQDWRAQAPRIFS